MKLIFLGAPGAGKGTQAAVVSERLSIPVISTGDIMRAAIKNGTELGEKAKSFIEAGQLVPDEIVIGLIRERLSEEDCADGFILDGVPRTVAQADALKDMGISVDKVLSLEVSDEEIIERMTGRRVCADCGATHHLKHNPPKVEGKCDRCGGELTVRKDDAPETVKDRLRVYHELTEPLKDYYKREGKLRTVQGTGTVADITRNVLSALEG